MFCGAATLLGIAIVLIDTSTLAVEMFYDAKKYSVCMILLSQAPLFSVLMENESVMTIFKTVLA